MCTKTHLLLLLWLHLLLEWRLLVLLLCHYGLHCQLQLLLEVLCLSKLIQTASTMPTSVTPSTTGWGLCDHVWTWCPQEQRPACKITPVDTTRRVMCVICIKTLERSGKHRDHLVGIKLLHSPALVGLLEHPSETGL